MKNIESQNTHEDITEAPRLTEEEIKVQRRELLEELRSPEKISRLEDKCRELGKLKDKEDFKDRETLYKEKEKRDSFYNESFPLVEEITGETRKDIRRKANEKRNEELKEKEIKEGKKIWKREEGETMEQLERRYKEEKEKTYNELILEKGIDIFLINYFGSNKLTGEQVREIGGRDRKAKENFYSEKMQELFEEAAKKEYSLEKLGINVLMERILLSGICKFEEIKSFIESAENNNNKDSEESFYLFFGNKYNIYRENREIKVNEAWDKLYGNAKLDLEKNVVDEVFERIDKTETEEGRLEMIEMGVLKTEEEHYLLFENCKSLEDFEKTIDDIYSSSSKEEENYFGMSKEELKGKIKKAFEEFEKIKKYSEIEEDINKKEALEITEKLGIPKRGDLDQCIIYSYRRNLEEKFKENLEDLESNYRKELEGSQNLNQTLEVIEKIFNKFEKNGMSFNYSKEEIIEELKKVQEEISEIFNECKNEEDFFIKASEIIVKIPSWAGIKDIFIKQIFEQWQKEKDQGVSQETGLEKNEKKDEKDYFSPSERLKKMDELEVEYKRKFEDCKDLREVFKEIDNLFLEFDKYGIEFDKKREEYIKGLEEVVKNRENIFKECKDERDFNKKANEIIDLPNYAGVKESIIRGMFLEFKKENDIEEEKSDNEEKIEPETDFSLTAPKEEDQLQEEDSNNPDLSDFNFKLEEPQKENQVEDSSVDLGETKKEILERLEKKYVKIMGCKNFEELFNLIRDLFNDREFTENIPEEFIEKGINSAERLINDINKHREGEIELKDLLYWADINIIVNILYCRENGILTLEELEWAGENEDLEKKTKESLEFRNKIRNVETIEDLIKIIEEEEIFKVEERERIIASIKKVEIEVSSILNSKLWPLDDDGRYYFFQKIHSKELDFLKEIPVFGGLKRKIISILIPVDFYERELKSENKDRIISRESTPVSNREELRKNLIKHIELETGIEDEDIAYALSEEYRISTAKKKKKGIFRKSIVIEVEDYFGRKNQFTPEDLKKILNDYKKEREKEAKRRKKDSEFSIDREIVFTYSRLFERSRDYDFKDVIENLYRDYKDIIPQDFHNFETAEDLMKHMLRCRKEAIDSFTASKKTFKDWLKSKPENIFRNIPRWGGLRENYIKVVFDLIETISITSPEE